MLHVSCCLFSTAKFFFHGSENRCLTSRLCFLSRIYSLAPFKHLRNKREIVRTPRFSQQPKLSECGCVHRYGLAVDTSRMAKRILNRISSQDGDVRFQRSPTHYADANVAGISQLRIQELARGLRGIRRSHHTAATAAEMSR